MIVDIAQVGDAKCRFTRLLPEGFEPVSQHVAHRLGAVAVAARPDEFVECFGKFRIQRYGESFHAHPYQCTVHTMHGSKDLTTCCTRTGFPSLCATGVPTSACSSAPGVPCPSRGEKFQVVGEMIW